MSIQDVNPQAFNTYAASVRAAAARYGVAEAVIWSVIAIESAFNPKAVSPAGAIGLMQLMPGTAADMKVDPYDAHQNIMGGTAYLRSLAVRYKNATAYILAAYNWGPGNLGLPPKAPSQWPAETQNYITRFLTTYTKIGGLFK